jgi:hypothetical protein
MNLLLLLQFVGVACVYLGLGLGLIGLMSMIRPITVLRIRNRRVAAFVCGLALTLLVIAIFLPAPRIRSSNHARIDVFMPEYQYVEAHSTRIHAPVDQVYRSIRQVTADEILFFQTLTWIRSPRLPGTQRSESILNAPGGKPILDVAMNSGFLLLAEDANREIVFGSIPCCKQGPKLHRPEEFLSFNEPAYAKATMNFLLQSDEPGWTRLTTETRVYAADPFSRRIFTVYWRLIYPGSAIIRSMWLSAIKKRAEHTP